MTLDRDDFRRILAGRAAGAFFAYLLAVWLLWQFGGLVDRMTGTIAAVLYPVWLPVYLAVLLASGLRNVYLPWLESGPLFFLTVVGFLYLEAIALAGLYRVVRTVYRSVRGGRARGVPS